jgi:hypothetical protein
LFSEPHFVGRFVLRTACLECLGQLLMHGSVLRTPYEHCLELVDRGVPISRSLREFGESHVSVGETWRQLHRSLKLRSTLDCIALRN